MKRTRWLIVALILPFVCGVSAYAAVILEGVDEVAARVGNRDGRITQDELSELIFRQALFEEYGHVVPCQYRGENSEEYDLNNDGYLDEGEYTCYVMGNRQRFRSELKARGKDASVADQMAAARFDPAFYRKVRKFSVQARIQHTVKGGRSPVAEVSAANAEANALLEWQKLSVASDLSFDEEGRWRIGRELVDKIANRRRKISRPLILSYKEDSEADNESLILRGDIAYNWTSDMLKEKNRLSIAQAILSGDVDSNEESFDSSVTFALKLTTYFTPKSDRWINEWALEATPSYTTDRHFRRDLYSLSLGASFASERLGAGYLSPADPVVDGRVRPWRWSWQPQAKLTIGEVRDAGGNEALAEQQGLGTFYRLVPRVDFELWPAGIAPRWRFTGSYSHLFGLGEGFDHGLAQVGVHYDLAKLIALTFSYRHGHDVTTLNRVDEWLVGVGVKH